MSHYSYRKVFGTEFAEITRQINQELARVSHAFVELAGEGERIAITTASYNVQLHDYLIAVNYAGAVTITLPDGSGEGKYSKFPFTLLVVDESGAASSNNITIQGNGNNINGASSQVINSNYGLLKVYFNGTEWFIIG